MPTDLMTLGYLGTYAGAVAATYLVVSYLKGLVKAVLPDYYVRLLALFVAGAILGFVLWATGKTDAASIGVGILNAFLVAFASMGLHEAASDPGATKSKPANPSNFVPKA